MLKLFKKDQEKMFVALAIVFSVIVLGYFIFGIFSAVHGIADVFNVSTNKEESPSLDLSTAKKLNLRGLVQ